MLKNELMKRSPIRVLENSIHGGLGKGNLGVFTARKGVGKTACLVHVAVDKLLRGQKVLHVSFAEDPHHIETWYEQVFREIARTYELENVLDNHDQVIQNRKIMHFKPPVNLTHVRESILRFAQALLFHPEMLIVDGFSFFDQNIEDFRFWKSLAEEMDVSIWFSATLHRHALNLDDKGIPEPVNRFMDLFSVILMLQPESDYIDIKLLKDHDSTEPDRLRLKLDPQTLLISNRRV